MSITDDINEVLRKRDSRRDAKQKLLEQVREQHPDLTWELAHERGEHGPARLIGRDESGEPCAFAHVDIQTRGRDGERLRTYLAKGVGWAPPFRRV